MTSLENCEKRVRSRSFNYFHYSLLALTLRKTKEYQSHLKNTSRTRSVRRNPRKLNWVPAKVTREKSDLMFEFKLSLGIGVSGGEND